MKNVWTEKHGLIQSASPSSSSFLPRSSFMRVKRVSATLTLLANSLWVLMLIAFISCKEGLFRHFCGFTEKGPLLHCYACHSGLAGIRPKIFSYKSLNSGLSCLIRSIFCCLLMFLICFSLIIALRLFLQNS